MLVLTIISYFVFNYWESRFERNIKNLNEKIITIKTDQEKETKKELFAAQQRIDDFSAALSSHSAVAEMFVFLGDICHPRVRFLVFEFTNNNGYYEVKIAAKADSYSALHQQTAIFKNEEKLIDFDISDISMATEGGVNFSLQLIVSPKVFAFN